MIEDVISLATAMIEEMVIVVETMTVKKPFFKRCNRPIKWNSRNFGKSSRISNIAKENMVLI